MRARCGENYEKHVLLLEARRSAVTCDDGGQTSLGEGEFIEIREEESPVLSGNRHVFSAD